MDVVNVALGRKPALGIGLENELVKYCLEMDATYYGLRRRDIKRMAFQLALRNNLRHPFSVSSASAGKKWLRNFLRRHPELSFRKPQSISIARVQAFTKENISRFFDVLKPELQKIKFKADRIFNVDESGITVVQHAPEDVRKFCLLTLLFCLLTLLTRILVQKVFPVQKIEKKNDISNKKF